MEWRYLLDKEVDGTPKSGASLVQIAAISASDRVVPLLEVGVYSVLNLSNWVTV